MGAKAICIVLSGTGVDGTLGLRGVKGAGGLTIVQLASQAQYSGMPARAIGVDLVLPVENMPEELIKYAGLPYTGSKSEDLAALDFVALEDVQKIVCFRQHCMKSLYSG